MSNEEKVRGSCIIPTIRYRNAAEAIEWLCDAFGFEKHLIVSDDSAEIAHAQLTLGTGMIMLGSAGDKPFDRLQAPLSEEDSVVSQSPYVVISDVDAHHAKAVKAGARVVMEPEDQDYGGRHYSCRDPDGNLWNFGSYDPWASA